MSRTFRFLLRWLAPVILAWACCLPAALAQGPAGGAKGGAASTSGGSLFIFEHVLALVGVGVTLIVVCMPSRKRF